MDELEDTNDVQPHKTENFLVFVDETNFSSDGSQCAELKENKQLTSLM